MQRAWHITPGWRGEDVFVIAGGTSVNPKVVAQLRGRPKAHVVAVNTSYLIAPWAEMLFFADDRWFKRELEERPRDIRAFWERPDSQIVTTARHTKHESLWHLKRIVPDAPGRGLAVDPGTVSLERTSVQGVLNIAFHKRAARIILVGVDNCDVGDRSHHHDEYPWPRREAGYKLKRSQLGMTVKPLADAGIEVINASLISTLPWWPKVDLATWLKEQDQ